MAAAAEANNTLSASNKRKNRSSGSDNELPPAGKRMSHLPKATFPSLPLTSLVDREYKKIIKEYGKNPSKIKPNLVQRKNKTNPTTNGSLEYLNTLSKNEQQWQTPRKTSPTKATPPAHNFNSTNTFSLLQNETSTASSIATDGGAADHEAAETVQGDNSLDKPTHGENSQSRPAQRKPPPIHCESTTTKTLIELLSPKLSSPNALRIADLTEGHQTVYIDNRTDHTVAIETLIEKKIKFYTYTAKDTKNKVLVLKGISQEYTPEEVKEALINLRLKDVSIDKVNTFKSSGNPTSNMLLVHITPDSAQANLRNVKGLLNQRIRWENLRKPNIFQCHNCQRVGHSSSNCQMGFRCVKCKVPHAPGECARAKDADTPPYCVNCDHEGHPANYRGCDYLKLAQATNMHVKSQKISTKNRMITNNYNSPADDQGRLTQIAQPHHKRSFADTIRTTGQRTPPPINNHLTSTDSNGVTIQQLQTLLGTFKQDIINTIIDNNVNIQQQVTTNAQRIDELFNIIQTKCQ